MNNNLSRTSISKEAQLKYRNLNNLILDKNIDEKIFTYKYLDILIELIDKINALLDQSRLNHNQKNKNKDKLSENMLNKAIDKILNMNNIEIKKLGYSIFLPGKSKMYKNLDGNLKELKIVDKYNEVIRVLYELYFGKDDFDIKVLEEQLNENKMRKIAYRIINFSTYNINKTILVSDEIGQATYIYDGYIDVRKFQEIKKGNQVNGVIPDKLIYGTNYSNKLTHILLKNSYQELYDNNLSEKEIQKEEEKFYVAEDIKAYFKNYEGRSEEENYEYWMNYESKKYSNISYKGKKIGTLSRLSGWNTSNINMYIKSKGFQKWINWIFGKEIKKITKEEIINYFKSYEGRTEEESYKYFKSLIQPDIIKIDYKGYKIRKIGKIYGLTDTKNLQKTKTFQIFINSVFGKKIKIEKISQEEIKNYFLTYEGGTEEENYKYWMNLSTEKINIINYKGNKISKIGTLSGWNNPNNIRVQNQGGFQEWINWIFGREIKEISVEEINNYFKNYEGRTQEESYNYWINLPRKEIHKIGYKGNKISNISKLSGWNDPNKQQLFNKKGFYKWVNWLFEK